MVETGNVTWDLIDQESAEATVGCEEGLYERIDWSKFKTESYLKGSLTDCGFGMYTAGNILAYDGDRFPEGPKSWADFWDVQKFPGKRGFWYTPKNTLEIALMADGVAPQDVYKELAAPGGIDRAFKKLDELKPNIVWWNAGAEFINRLASGEYAMTFAWNGRIDAANMTDKRNFKIAWEAGFTYVIDQWVIVKGTPNLDKAYDFLSFFDNKERQADWMTKIAYASTNLAAMDLLTPERRAVMPLAPENVKFGVPVDDAFWAEHYDSLTERFNAWAGQAQ
jgi:putative spermidine/putrescine transport system substrate-binding protein